MHSRRPALPGPAAQPAPAGDHELLIDFAEALPPTPPRELHQALEAINASR